VPPEPQLAVEVRLGHGQSPLLPGGGGRLGDPARQPGQRGTAPQVERGPQQPGGLGGLPGRGLGPGGQGLEAGRVQVIGAQTDPVAGRLGLDQVRAPARGQRPPQPRHDVAGLLGRRGGRIVLPQRVDQPADRDQAAGLEQQDGQHLALGRP
jgi:hypothetical protein